MAYTMVNGLGGKVIAGNASGVSSNSSFGFTNAIVNGIPLKPTPAPTVTYQWQPITLVVNRSSEANARTFLTDHPTMTFVAKSGSVYCMQNAEGSDIVSGSLITESSLPTPADTYAGKVVKVGSAYYILTTRTIATCGKESAWIEKTEYTPGSPISPGGPAKVTFMPSDASAFSFDIHEIMPSNAPAELGTFTMTAISYESDYQYGTMVDTDTATVISEPGDEVKFTGNLTGTFEVPKNSTFSSYAGSGKIIPIKGRGGDDLWMIPDDAAMNVLLKTENDTERYFVKNDEGMYAEPSQVMKGSWYIDRA